MTTGTVSSATASTTSDGSDSSRAHTIRKAPVPISGSGRIGRPRIVSHPSRSTSNGFIATATAGNGQLELWASIALLMASRFLTSESRAIAL